jgi:hypothetical protein
MAIGILEMKFWNNAKINLRHNSIIKTTQRKEKLVLENLLSKTTSCHLLLVKMESTQSHLNKRPINKMLKE